MINGLPTEGFEPLAELDARLARVAAGVEAVEWDGMPVWPLLRMAIMRRLSIARTDIEPSEGTLVTGKRMGSLVVLARSFLASRPTAPAPDDAGRPGAMLVVTRNIAQRAGDAGTQSAKKWHPTIEKLSLAQAEAHEAATAMAYFWPDAATLSDLVEIKLPDGSHLPGRVDMLKAVLSAYRRRNDAQLRTLVDPIIDRAWHEPGFGGIGTNQYYRNDIAMVRFWRNRFRELIATLRLNRIYFQCYYTTVGFGAVLAAREAGIAAIDVQHGLAGPNHYAYAWQDAPPSAEVIIPDRFLMWSDADAQSLATNLPFALSTAVVGSNWGNWIARHPVLAVRMEAAKMSLSGLKRPGRRLIVHLLARGERADVAARIRSALPEGVDMAVRAHPNDLAALGDAGYAPTALDLAASNAWLPALVDIADGVIGAHSAACLEAAMWPRPTLLFGEKARFLFDGYFELADLAWTADIETELPIWIARIARPSAG